MIQEIQDAVHKCGWWVGGYDAPLSTLARALGTPVPARANGPLLDLLTVRCSIDAHPNSLSSRHGCGAFPIHTDGAHHVIVPKYVILRMTSQRPSERGTILVDFRASLRSDEEKMLRHELWIVRTGRRAFLAPILDGPYLRFDFDIMSPALPIKAITAGIVRDVCVRAPSLVVKWHHCHTLLIDNHRIVHGREASTVRDSGEGNRALERILVRAHDLEV